VSGWTFLTNIASLDRLVSILMDKAIVKVNQNEFNRYENLINRAYVVSQSILPFTDYTYKWSSFGQ
jgi:hypothetical protein